MLGIEPPIPLSLTPEDVRRVERKLSTHCGCLRRQMRAPITCALMCRGTEEFSLNKVDLFRDRTSRSKRLRQARTGLLLICQRARTVRETSDVRYDLPPSWLGQMRKRRHSVVERSIPQNPEQRSRWSILHIRPVKRGCLLKTFT